MQTPRGLIPVKGRVEELSGVRKVVTQIRQTEAQCASQKHPKSTMTQDQCDRYSRCGRRHGATPPSHSSLLLGWAPHVRGACEQLVPDRSNETTRLGSRTARSFREKDEQIGQMIVWCVDILVGGYDLVLCFDVHAASSAENRG